MKRLRPLVLGAVASALLELCGCVGEKTPASTGTVTIDVDATRPGAPLERIWAFHGYDEVNYTRLPEGKALLASIAGLHSAPVHVRNHFLFNTGDGTPDLKWGSTNVYTEDAAGAPVYDFALTDGILDALTGAGVYPFVELGFMPEALSTHPKPYRNATTLALNGGCFYPPTDHEKWAALVRTWATHVSGRYPDVPGNWLWELWNEPDSSYWHGSFDDYAKLYDYTESALHEAIPDAALGGPAVIDPAGDFLKQFLQHCSSGTNAVTASTGTRLDLVTFHAKGGTSVSGDQVQMNLGNQLRLHQAGFEAVAAFPEFRQTPIYITEADPDGCAACPADIVPGAAYRTSTAYGAYEMAMMKRTLELEAAAGVKLGGVLTWAFTFPDTPYFAGYRELASHGIHLPVLSAFELLGRLQGARLPLTSSGALSLDELLNGGARMRPDIDGIAALNDGTIQVLVWNYHDDVTNAPPTQLHVAIRLPASFGSTAKVSQLRVDDSHGDAFSVWQSQGAPATPSADQVAELERAMHPVLLASESAVKVPADHTLPVDFELPRFGISLVTVAE